jgi:hypothetical protein
MKEGTGKEEDKDKIKKRQENPYYLFELETFQSYLRHMGHSFRTVKGIISCISVAQLFVLCHKGTE